MSKEIKIYTDSEGNEMTHYGCATIQDACDLGNTTAAGETNKLIILDDVLNNNLYNVSLVENPNVEYSDNRQAVAYVDLMQYEGLPAPLSSSDNQKLGVMVFSDSYTYTALTAVGNTTLTKYLLKDSQLIPDLTVNANKTVIEPGCIKVYLNSINNIYVNQTTRFGYEIIFQNFIDSLYDGASLEIKSVTFQDCIDSREATTVSEYNTSFDTSPFGFSSTTQKRTVVENGSQISCAMIKQSATDAKYSQFNNFDSTTAQTLSVMIVSVNGSNANPEYDDKLLSTIELELKYQSLDEDSNATFLAVSPLRIELWQQCTVVNRLDSVILEKDAGGVLPEVEDNESGKTISIDPDRTILYTTSTEFPLAGYTDALASEFAGGVSVENAGYATLSDGTLCGYIQYVNPITTVGTGMASNLFTNNQDILTTVTLPEGVVEISDKAFLHCRNLQKVRIPETVRQIKYQAFYGCGLTEIQLPTTTVDDPLFLYGYAFSDCNNLKEITGNFYIECPQDTSCQFSYCTSLISDIVDCISGYDGVLPEEIFAGCTSLKCIKSRFHTYQKSHSSVWPFTQSTRTHKSFYNCTGLKTIYIDRTGDSDSSGYNRWGYASNTFEGCVNVENIYCNSTWPPFLGAKNIWKAGGINPRTCQLYIPTGCTNAYNSKAQWGDFPLSNIHELTQEEFEEIKASL